MLGNYPRIHRAYLGAVAVGITAMNAMLAINPLTALPLLCLGSSGAKSTLFYTAWSSDPELEEEIRAAHDRVFAATEAERRPRKNRS